MITTITSDSQNISTIDAQRTQAKTQAQQKMVKDSLTRAFDELHSGKAHKDARKLFIN